MYCIRVDMEAVEAEAERDKKNRDLFYRWAEVINQNPIRLSGDIEALFEEAFAVECDYYDTKDEVLMMMGTRESAREAAKKILAATNGKHIDDGTAPSRLVASYLNGDISPIVHETENVKDGDQPLASALERFDNLNLPRNKARRALSKMLGEHEINDASISALLSLLSECPRALIKEPIKRWRDASKNPGESVGAAGASL